MDKEYVIKQLQIIAGQYDLNLELSALESLVLLASIRIIKKNEILCHIGELAKKVGIVLSGILRCYYIDCDGNDITKGFSTAGAFCMDEGMFGYDEYICEWEALGDAVIIFFDVDKFKEKVYEYNDLKNAYILFLEKSLQYKIYRENSFLTENASQRYIKFKNTFPEICEKVQQRNIATYLGIAPESLSRIRKAMKEKE